MNELKIKSNERIIRSDDPTVENDMIEFLNTDYHFSIDEYSIESGILVKHVGESEFLFIDKIDTIHKARNFLKNKIKGQNK